jgi:hypothetical protein
MLRQLPRCFRHEGNKPLKSLLGEDKIESFNFEKIRMTTIKCLLGKAANLAKPDCLYEESNERRRT